MKRWKGGGKKGLIVKLPKKALVTGCYKEVIGTPDLKTPSLVAVT